MTRLELAGNVIHTYVALILANQAEPALNDVGRPHDPEAWTQWYLTSFVPTNRAWNDAMDALEAALGDDFPGWHPDDFMVYCAEVIIQARG